jgi:hypothetical protein
MNEAGRGRGASGRGIQAARGPVESELLMREALTLAADGRRGLAAFGGSVAAGAAAFGG